MLIAMKTLWKSKTPPGEVGRNLVAYKGLEEAPTGSIGYIAPAHRLTTGCLITFTEGLELHVSDKQEKKSASVKSNILDQIVQESIQFRVFQAYHLQESSANSFFMLSFRMGKVCAAGEIKKTSKSEKRNLSEKCQRLIFRT